MSIYLRATAAVKVLGLYFSIHGLARMAGEILTLFERRLMAVSVAHSPQVPAWFRYHGLLQPALILVAAYLCISQTRWLLERVGVRDDSNAFPAA